jgi:hypothetical protein
MSKPAALKESNTDAEPPNAAFPLKFRYATIRYVKLGIQLIRPCAFLRHLEQERHRAVGYVPLSRMSQPGCTGLRA